MSLSTDVPQPILMGRHLINELGWKAGPEFRPVLEAAFQAQIEGRVNTLAEALALAKTMGNTGLQT